MRALTLCLCLSVAGLWACRAAEPKWAETGVRAVSERVLWDVCTLAMERNGFPPSADQDRAAGHMVSGWRVSLQPFKSQGQRERCEIQFEPGEGGVWNVGVRVEKETNEELSRPLEPEFAQWKPAPDDESAAARVLGTIRVLLGARPSNDPAPGAPTSGSAPPAGRGPFHAEPFHAEPTRAEPTWDEPGWVHVDASGADAASVDLSSIQTSSNQPSSIHPKQGAPKAGA
jgi:hypothetical protein